MLRVDTKNPLLRLLVVVYGWIFGLLFYCICLVWRSTVRLEGKEGRDLLLKERYVLVLWHEDLILFFLAFSNLPNQIWMNHPAWFMKPIHVTLYLMGVRNLALGSSGNSGQLALEKVVQGLHQGLSTVVAVDGPAGPPKVMKPGAMRMSLLSGVPLRTLRFECSRFFRVGGWDRKRVPYPFSQVDIRIGNSEFIKEESEITKERMESVLTPN
ncbi:MAG: hypothetical protein K1X82_13285 [Bacteroidia bacterium]|nr:hypothetical protein [Bacteroidia bacterium]